MACGRAVCEECATTWEGIHHCAPCLARLGRRAPARAALPGLLAVLVGAGALFWALVRLMVWAGVMAVEVL